MSIQLEKFALGTVPLANFTANGTIGTAAATVDICSSVRIPQTTANISLTIPNPTVATVGQLLTVINSGTVPVTVGGESIAASQSALFVFSGTAWTPSAWRSPNVIVFNASGTYTASPGLRYAIVEMVGAGGGSGGSRSSVNASTVLISGGGGAGGYIKALLTAAQIGASQTVVIGAGGTAGLGGAVPTAGGTGANTSLGALLTANGGVGSPAGVAGGNFPVQSRIGGAGGARTISVGVDLGSSNGDMGGSGFAAVNGTGTALMPGQGASSRLGNGANTTANFFNNARGTALAGVAASANTGGGASGTGCGGAAGATGPAGSAGGSGKMIITEYFN